MEKPIEPGPCDDQRLWSEYAQAKAHYSAWLATQPHPAEQVLQVQQAPAAPKTPPAPVFDPATGEWKLP